MAKTPPSPFRTEAFRRVKADWYARLEKEGFEDIESKKGRLKEYNTRLNWHNRESTAALYTRMEHMLNADVGIPRRDKAILELYIQGKPVKGPRGIARALRLHYQTVYAVVRRYQRAAVQGYFGVKDV